MKFSISENKKVVVFLAIFFITCLASDGYVAKPDDVQQQTLVPVVAAMPVIPHKLVHKIQPLETAPEEDSVENNPVQDIRDYPPYRR